MRLVLLSALLMMLAGHDAFSQTNGARAARRQFIQDAVDDQLAGIALSSVAAQRAQSRAVREFAQRVVQENSIIRNRLRSLARTNRVAIASGLTEEQQRQVQLLSGLTGSDLDRAFISSMVSNLNLQLSTFRDQAANGTGAVQRFADQVSPTLENDLVTALTLEQGTVCAGTGAGTGTGTGTGTGGATGIDTNGDGIIDTTGVDTNGDGIIDTTTTTGGGTTSGSTGSGLGSGVSAGGFSTDTANSSSGIGTGGSAGGLPINTGTGGTGVFGTSFGSGISSTGTSPVSSNTSRSSAFGRGGNGNSAGSLGSSVQ